MIKPASPRGIRKAREYFARTYGREAAIDEQWALSILAKYIDNNEHSTQKQPPSVVVKARALLAAKLGPVKALMVLRGEWDHTPALQAVIAELLDSAGYVGYCSTQDEPEDARRKPFVFRAGEPHEMSDEYINRKLNALIDWLNDGA